MSFIPLGKYYIQGRNRLLPFSPGSHSCTRIPSSFSPAKCANSPVSFSCGDACCLSTTHVDSCKIQILCNLLSKQTLTLTVMQTKTNKQKIHIPEQKENKDREVSTNVNIVDLCWDYLEPPLILILHQPICLVINITGGKNCLNLHHHYH